MPLFTHARCPRRRFVVGRVLIGTTGLALVAGTAAPETLAAQSAARSSAPSPIDFLERRSVPPPTTRLRTGPTPELVGELRVPPGPGPFPVAIVVHGGCWLSRFADDRHLHPLAEALRAQEGIATWTVRYRRADEPGGGWPGTFTDLAAAADSVRALAGRYPLDTSRVIVVGHSAGATLGGWLAARPFLPEADTVAATIRGRGPLAVRGLVALDGPVDLIAARPIARPVCGADVLDQLIGASPETGADRWRAASPSVWLGADRPELRQAVVTGGLDARLSTRVPSASLREYARRSGARSFLADTTDHFNMLDPTNPAWQATRAAVHHALGRAP